jgi:hypothetical protein
MFDLDLHWCERRRSRRHGLLGCREHVACGRPTCYVLRTRDSEVRPSRVKHALLVAAVVQIIGGYRWGPSIRNIIADHHAA